MSLQQFLNLEWDMYRDILYVMEKLVCEQYLDNVDLLLFPSEKKNVNKQT